MLSCFNLFGVFCRFFLKTTLKQSIWLFDVSGDKTIPTWYASVTLLACSVLILIIGLIHLQKQNQYAKQWIVLAGIFLFLSIDEVATIHEWSTHLITVPAVDGFLYYDWVIFGIIFVIIVGLYYRRLLNNLPCDIKNLFLLAALFFVGGAIGVEIINSKIGYLEESETISYALMTALEEFFEMVGVATFIYALLKYLNQLVTSDTLQIRLRQKTLDRTD